MEEGRLFNKSNTARAGQTMGPYGSGQNAPTVMPPPVQVSTPGNSSFVGEDESIHTLTGPGDGQAVGGTGTPPKIFGWTGPNGNSVHVNDTDGTLQLQHQSGSSVFIDADGAVFVSSESSRGVGISAPFGDAFISASGHLILDAASVSIKAAGDLTLDVGGTLTISAKGIQIKTNTLDEIIDGSTSRSVTNDSSTIIGGIKRDTVAGDFREQVTGNKIQDVGGDLAIRATGDVGISAGGDVNVASGGDNKFTSGGGTDIKAGGPVKLDGSSVHASPLIDRAQWSQSSDNAALAETLGGSAQSMPAAQGAASADVIAAEVVDAEDIVDELTSQRKYPEFPGNAKWDSASGGSVYTVAHDYVPQSQEVYDEYSGANQGNFNPAMPGESMASIPAGSNDSTAQESPYGVPSKYNKGTKISRYFTLGQLLDAPHSHEIPASIYEEVVKQHVKLAFNVLDPIKMKFPDIVITSVYRGNSSNHKTGKAVDIVVQSRNLAKHAEIARFAMENLPVDQVFLEKNTSGRTHVHLRVSDSGGSPRVMTCGDPQCRSNTAGIDVSYLQRKGVA